MAIFLLIFTNFGRVLISLFACVRISTRGDFMKIGIFTDSHICECDDLGLGRHPRLSKQRLISLMDVFEREKVEAIICLGDLVDQAKGETKSDVLSHLSDTVSIISRLGVPFYLVGGNHDFLSLSRKELEENGILLSPFTICDDNACIIALDANFREGNLHFDEAGEKWDDAHIPPEQLSMLDRTLEGASVPCVVLIHENLDPCVDFWHQVRNAPEARAIIKKHSSKIALVLQGHFHWGAHGTYNGVPYEALKSICVFDSDNYKILDTSKI